MKKILASITLAATLFTSLPVYANTVPSDTMLVAALVWHEAGNQSYQGKRLVADVVYNRVMSPLFPNTVTEVLDQKYQFMPVKDLQAIVDSGVPQDCIDAAIEEQADQLDFNILYFNNTRSGLSGEYAYQVGGHYFGR